MGRESENMKKLFFSLLAMAVGTFASASTLDLIPTKPDINTDTIEWNWHADTGILNISGTPRTLSFSTVTSFDYYIVDSYFLIQEKFDVDGNLESGQLTIVGSLIDANTGDPNGPLSGTLLTGIIVDQDWNTTTGQYQFIFDTTGGTLSDLYPEIGVNLINNNTLKVADTFPIVTSVPTPAALPAGIVVLSGLVLCRKHRK
jgi:hypothetical protein